MIGNEYWYLTFGSYERNLVAAFFIMELVMNLIDLEISNSFSKRLPK